MRLEIESWGVSKWDVFPSGISVKCKLADVGGVLYTRPYERNYFMVFLGEIGKNIGLVPHCWVRRPLVLEILHLPLSVASSIGWFKGRSARDFHFVQFSAKKFAK